MLDVRDAQDRLEDALRDAVLYALGKRSIAATSVAELRALTTRGATGSAMHDDMLAALTLTGVTSSFRWNGQSTATDDGALVIKPDDVTGNGRWLNWTSPMRLAPTVGGNSYYLHELTSGPLERVILLDRNMDDAEVSKLIFGQVPSVIIEATDDTPADMTQITGHRWDTQYHFTVSTITQNLRDRRQAAQGSKFSGESTLGANKIDGLIQTLLGGTQLYGVLDGIRNVQVGRGYNWISEQAQRRVIRGRAFVILATVENPAAPNDTGLVEEIDAQAELTDLGDDASDPWDLDDDVVTEGLSVGLGVGLSGKTVRAGVATIAGETVTFVGEMRDFTASVATYRDLNPDGTMTYVEAGIFETEPPVTDGALRVGVTTTDGSGIIADRLIARSRVAYGPNVQHPMT